METLVPVLVGGLAAGLAVAGGVLGALSWFQERRMAHWREGARRVALSAREETPGRIVGWSGNLRVTLEPYFRSRDDKGTRLTIAGPGLAASRFSFRPEAIDTFVLHRAGRHDVQSGDSDFDGTVWIEGDEATVLAVLDAPAREGLRSLARGQLARPGRTSYWASGRCDDGALEIRLPEDLPRDEPSAFGGEKEALRAPLYLGGLSDHLPDAAEAALDLARRLAAPGDVPGRLLGRFETEPDSGVRLRLLDVLSRAHGGSPAAAKAARLALQDPDADVRVRGALAVGAPGRPVLLGVAHGEGAADTTSARAVAVLAGSLTVAEANGLLRNALRLRKLETVRACLRVLGARGGPAAVEMLARVLSVERGEEGDWAAEALGATGDPRGEVALLHELDAREETRRLAAARALGEAASVAAVPALRVLEENDPRLRRTAREAIARIQARQAGAGPGQLSLAEDATGRLSLSNVEAGRLSFPPHQGGAR